METNRPESEAPESQRPADQTHKDPVREELEREDAPWQPIDFVLKQGDSDELAQMRTSISNDPMLAIELAETVDVIEQFRQVRTEASAEFAGKMAALTERAERRLTIRGQARRGQDGGDGWSRRVLPMVGLLAAAATFSLLWWLDPLDRIEDASKPGGKSYAIASQDHALETGGDAGQGTEQDILQRSEIDWRNALEVIGDRLALERSPRLRDAFEHGLRDANDPLSQWLDPRNAMQMLRLDHELRANAEVRVEALARRGGLVAVDDRVQELADIIAEDLLALELPVEGSAAGQQDMLASVAYSMRALIGAGSNAARARALRVSGDWLARQLPQLHGDQLVQALSGLTELAAISGQHFEAVAHHGQRFIDELLVPDQETWARRRPVLLGGRIAPRTLGEAARISQRLVAFGVDGERCHVVRSLVLGQLYEQRDVGQERPEVLAAILYGCEDLLESREVFLLQLSVRRWNLARLSPDFVTVQQLAWSFAPGDRGFARMQRELRGLSVLPVPTTLQERAAFCLCLATNYAGFVGGLSAQTRSPRGS